MPISILLHLNLYRFIKAGNKETLPVGVFVKRRQMVLLTLKQLMELKKVCIKDTDTRVILHMKFNQGNFILIRG